MKKRGFTLVELVVVIALIAILAVTLAPRLRDQIAKANDSKAIAILGSLRTQSEVYFAENEEPVFGTTGAGSTTITGALDLLIADLDDSAQKLFDKAGDEDNIWDAGENNIPIGGSRATSTDSITYGGEITYDFGTTGDGVSIFFETDTAVSGSITNDFDTKKKEWEIY